MYSVDSELVVPYQDKFDILLKTDEFKEIVGDDLLFRLNYIRKRGNIAAHRTKDFT
jgi:type I restriction enzyme R subunit